MKIVRFLSISILLSVFFSCSHGFLKDPRLYNPKRVTVQTVAPEPELQLTGGVDPFDKIDEWYNNPDSNGDENNKEKEGFSAEEFNQIQITGWFSDKNVPTYTMTKGDVWKEGDATKREYVHSNAPSTEGQGWSITGVTYYQYRGINPNYEATGNYNVSLQMTAAEEPNPKLSRFYFYRFTGKGGGVQWLDNYLIAVDTYSKLIFAFSEPVEFSSMGAPTKWDPTDNEAFYGQMYQFYMYDPVGYVLKKDDGSYEIQLYQWFQDSLASGNYKAKIDTAYENIAEKRGKNAEGKDGAGKSPFNSHDVDFFEENMKLLDKTKFLRREVTSEGRNGVVLYRYDFNSEGTQITRTAESWNDLPTDTPLDTVIYTIGNGKSATSATEGKITKDGVEGTLKLEDESRTLILTIGDETEVIGLIDYGPDFLERVKGSQYKSVDGKTSYEFSEDGTTLVFKADGKTYNYKFEKSFGTNRTEAVFGSNDASAYYAGFRLSNRDGKADGKIQCTTRSAFWAETVDWSMGYAANRVEKLKEDFKSSVAGKTFSLREYNDNDGYTKTLWSWTFDDTGDTATFVTTIWNQGTPQKGTAVTVENGDTSTTGRIGSKEAILHFDEKSGVWTLKVDNKDYEFIYNDPTPSFLNRVKGEEYVGCGWSYKFSDDGKTITATSGSKTETYYYKEKGNSSACAVYEQDGAIFLKYYGLKLSSNDFKLTRSWGDGFSTTGEAKTYADGAKDWAAWKKPILGSNFHETVANRGWQIRKDNADYDGSEDGLELLTWEFSSDGKTATMYEEVWREERRGEGETFNITSTDSKSGTSTNGYTFTLSDDLMTLTVTGGSDSGRTYKFGYDDPGPAWQLRVKGRTYFNSKYMYVFSDDGSSVDFYEGGEKKETWPLSEADSSRTKAVYTGSGLLFKYWGMKLENSDRDLYVTTGQGTGKEVLGFAYGDVLNENE